MAGLSQENKLRDVFNPQVVKSFAVSVKKVWPQFNEREFSLKVINGLTPLSFIERSNLIRDCLNEFLPQDYPTAVNILLKALGPEIPCAGDTVWEAFIIMPQCSFVATYGKGHYDLSMKALYEMTKRFTAEGDLKFFLDIDYERTMTTLHAWSKDSSAHVRRLVSEGTRPRLPLAGRIPRFQKDPRPLIKLLENLINDPSLYVRRSVANNINDIAKDNPDIAVATLKKWNKEKSPNVKWIVRHAARTLIKQGNSAILEVLGYPHPPEISVSRVSIKNKIVKKGDRVEFSFDITSLAKKPQPLIVDFALHFVKANGQTKPKIFKCREVKLQENEFVHITSYQKMIDTAGRTIFPGRHQIEPQINGVRYPSAEFHVK